MDDFNKNDFSLNDSNPDNEFHLERKPQNDGYDTFSLRTDPSELLKRFERQLRNKYIKNHKDGKKTEEQIPGTEPLCNEMGIQEILFELKSIVNNHTVQGNQSSINEHRLRMREIADDITIFFYSHYETWELEAIRVNGLINSAYWLIDFFISRTLDNKERELYGETYKENTSREVKQDKGKGGFVTNALSKMLAR